MSPSTRTVLYPASAKESARFDAMRDFPSPGAGLDTVRRIGPAGSKQWARLRRIVRNASTTCAASSEEARRPSPRGIPGILPRVGQEAQEDDAGGAVPAGMRRRHGAIENAHVRNRARLGEPRLLPVGLEGLVQLLGLFALPP